MKICLYILLVNRAVLGCKRLIFDWVPYIQIETLPYRYQDLLLSVSGKITVDLYKQQKISFVSTDAGLLFQLLNSLNLSVLFTIFKWGAVKERYFKYDAKELTFAFCGHVSLGRRSINLVERKKYETRLDVLQDVL